MYGFFYVSVVEEREVLRDRSRRLLGLLLQRREVLLRVAGEAEAVVYLCECRVGKDDSREHPLAFVMASAVCHYARCSLLPPRSVRERDFCCVRAIPLQVLPEEDGREERQDE